MAKKAKDAYNLTSLQAYVPYLVQEILLLIDICIFYTIIYLKYELLC
jgi:hypothetical protein